MATNPVITHEQARTITKGREPLVPMEFEEAVNSLIQCRQIEDAKYWADKASALAAWAKIYHSQKVEREAKLLKLHAYRRMAELAKEIKKANGTAPAKTLQGHGFTKWEADEVLAVGRASQERFEAALAADKPPAPSVFRKYSDNLEAGLFSSMRSFYTFCSNVPATTLAARVEAKDRTAVKRLITRIAEWCDELDQELGE